MINFNKVLNEFIAELEYIQGKSVNTIAAYKHDILLFGDYCARMDVGFQFAEKRFADEYLRQRAKNTSVATATREHAALKKFYKFLVARDYAGSSPFTASIRHELGAPTLKPVEPLKLEDVQALLNAPNPSTIKGMRDRAILAVLFATGCQISELSNLDINDFSSRDASIFFHKSRRVGAHRVSPLYPQAVRQIESYLLASRPKIYGANGNSLLFINMDGERFSRQGLWKIIKNYSEKLGIENVSPNNLRNTVIFEMMSWGASAHEISDILKIADEKTLSRFDDAIRAHMKSRL
ncbi:tyrosine recombinase XerD [Clostridia bacterium]|nr:tyrosine recombinase XerD [Clostridia bacterium]